MASSAGTRGSAPTSASPTLSSPPAKRTARSQQPDRSAKKASAKAQRKKPTPLIDLGQEMAQGLATSSSAGSVEGMAAAHQGSPPRAVASTTSSASSTMSKGIASPPSKRTRKSSFPLLFGRKSLDSSRAAAAAAPSQPGPMPMTPCSPTATYGEQHVVYSTHYESSTSLPSSSRESLPGGPPNRGQLFNPSTALPSPPETPVLATRPLSKKELKAREKEEMALIRELEKIDKMVREHDNKARKAAERAHAKEQKRAAAADKQQQQPQAATKRASNAFKRITIFSAASKAGPAVSVGRRGSVMRKRETLVSEDGRAKAPVSAGSVTSPKEGRFQFPMPPSTPPTPRRGTPDSPGKGARPPPVVVVTDAEDESVRGPASPAARSDGQKDSEELDQSTWRSQDWADLDPRRSSTFTSLIKRNEPSSGSTRPAAPPSSYRFAAAIDEDEEDAAGDGEERSGFSPKLSKRGSVQRALAMADAEETMLRKRSSIRRRGDRSPQPQSPPLQGPQSPQLQQQHQPQQQKRSSRRLNSSGGLSSKRSSVASDTRRRSLIRQLDAFEGWEVADQPELERQTSLDMANWVDSLDGPSQEQGDGDDGVDFPLPSTASAMMQEMLHVDRVLKDLQAAQAAQAADGSSSAAGSTSSGGSSEAKLAATPRSSARELDGSLDDGQSTPRASVAGISRPNIPTISFTPASVDSGLDQIGALGSPIPTDRASGMPSRDRSARFSRPTKSDKRRDSNPASPTSPRSPVHARPADAEVRCAGSPPTTSSSSSSCASTSSTASSPTTSATTTFSSTASSPVSPSRKAEFRISMAPFQPIDLFGVDVDGIVGTADDI
ncbi:uncharacterized protein PSFLO_07219 [Pseudozyma flocculosa]|uniref:Uncharacterized protein n=1 Tax=Pseudozyma flocculosa TaxID=84751 RepID=A0A5C3FDM9_9BASI|nr:uncharacterized protein PSFLO_07219 [Pseudozyma flocculosa]